MSSQGHLQVATKAPTLLPGTRKQFELKDVSNVQNVLSLQGSLYWLIMIFILPGSIIHYTAQPTGFWSLLMQLFGFTPHRDHFWELCHFPNEHRQHFILTIPRLSDPTCIIQRHFCENLVSQIRDSQENFSGPVVKCQQICLRLDKVTISSISPQMPKCHPNRNNQNRNIIQKAHPRV